MHVLQKQHIVDLFVWADDAVASLPQTEEKAISKGGRPPALHDSELLTILIWDGAQRTAQDAQGCVLLGTA